MTKQFPKSVPGLFLFLLIALAGCQEPSTADKILKNDKGLFRGLELGDGREAVIAAEGEPKEEEDGLLSYEYEIEEPEGRDSKYQLSYKIHEKHGLVEITLETNLQKDEDVKALFSLLGDHYKARIGPPNEEEENYVYWEYENEQFKGINVHLHDKSREWKYGRVFLRIFIWPLED